MSTGKIEKSCLSRVGEEILRGTGLEGTYLKGTGLKETGLDNSCRVKCLNYVARLFVSVDHYDQALVLYKRALKLKELCLCENSFEPNSLNVWIGLNKLAEFNISIGQCVQAEQFCEQAAEIIEKTLGLDHPLMSIPQNRLARCYIFEGKNTKAESLCKKSLEIMSRFFEPDHLYMSDTLETWATLRLYQGKYNQVKSFCKRLLKISA